MDVPCAGREDFDVRMLGTGRPFVLEIINARAAVPPQCTFDAMQAALQQVRELVNPSPAYCAACSQHQGLSRVWSAVLLGALLSTYVCLSHCTVMLSTQTSWGGINNIGKETCIYTCLGYKNR